MSEALDGLPAVSRYRALLECDQMALTEAASRRRDMTRSAFARGLAGLHPIKGDQSYPRNWDPTQITNSKRTVHTPSTQARFEATKPGEVEPKSRLYRLPLDGPSRTLRAGTGSDRGSHTSPRPIHPTQNRVVTVREAARLHGYPDWFRFHVTNWHGHRQVGNSVPPPLARAAGEALVASLGFKVSRPANLTPLGDSSLLRMTMAQAMEHLGVDADQGLPRPIRRPLTPLRGESDS